MTMPTHSLTNHTVIALATSVALLLLPATTVLAHAVVYPAEAPPRAYQKYVLRVPNERGFPTTRVRMTFPPGVRVIAFDEVPGWTLEATSLDDGATFTGATWTGMLPVGRFVEFAFIGVNPAEPTTLKWDAVQEYGDGTVVEWTGPPDSSTPASLTLVQLPPEGGGARSGSGGTGAVLGGVALLIAMVSLGLVLRPAGRS